ncbi:MAG TPA: TonB family protein [Pyrinomonadaceae bacterium]|nr:TonB family protein [Pyrinomonadaceae bacterium]
MRQIFLSAALAVVCSVGALAQDAPDPTEGTLYATARDGKELGACPLKHTSVNASISGFTARVKVVQEFENSFAVPIEAVYRFPLPNDAAVDDMTMTVGGRTILGRILKKGEARRIYSAAKREGKVASLLDQERPNIFTQSVANIPGGGKILIEISYVQTLKFNDGGYEFVFPMTVAPRYLPASGDSDDDDESESESDSDSEDAENTPASLAATRGGQDISINVHLNAGVSVERVRSATHTVSVVNVTANTADIALQSGTTIPNKDFVLRYDVIGKRMESSLLATRKGSEGYFNFILSPPERLSSADLTPKEIVFVLDTSGSMSGFPITKAKESMKLAMDALYPEDTFNLITFAGDTHVLFEKPVLATQANIEKAQAFLESRSSDGGTEMMAAVKAALAPSGSQEHIRIVCFMTDGEVDNDMEIIAEVKKYSKARVFAFGIGDSVNRFLLDAITREGRGEVEYVTENDDGSAAARRFHERIRNPYLTDISIDWGSLRVSDVYPKRIPDLFDAKPIVLAGRYGMPGAGKIRLRGNVGGMPFEREIEINLPAEESTHDSLATIWARNKIEDLMVRSWNDTLEESTPTLAVKNQIIKLGLDHRLMTQYTSFVAVEERMVSRVRNGKRVRFPIYAPAGSVVETELGDVDGEGYGSGSGSGAGGMGSAPGPPPAIMTMAPDSLRQPLASVSHSPAVAPSGAPKIISAGVINGAAVSLPKPEYPAAGRAAAASGTVSVQVTVDESGNVISATPISGHPLLRAAAQDAAAKAKFSATQMSGQPVKTTGVITYNFVDSNVTLSPALPIQASPPLPRSDHQETVVVEIPREMIGEAKLKQTLHRWLYTVVERLWKDHKVAGPYEAMFVRNGSASIVISPVLVNDALMAKLESLGVKIVSRNAKEVVGTVAIEKLREVASLPEVKLILPKIY